MFTEKCNQLFSALGDNKIMCLATSQSDYVTARSMSVIIYNDKFYFQTDTKFIKYKQICSNPHVALCINNIQIEGLCKEMGSPLLLQNSFFADLYRQHFGGSFEKYSALRSEVLFEVDPVKISIWNYDDKKPYQEFFDFSEKSYKKEYYKLTGEQYPPKASL